MTQDLRGVLHDVVSSDESWHELTDVLHHLVTVTSLHIGSCPASVVHAVTDQMFWLQHFSAENIANPDRFIMSYCCHVAMSCCIDVVFLLKFLNRYNCVHVCMKPTVCSI